MTVKVLEPSPAGHRLYYVRVLAEGCAEPVEWFTTREAAQSVMAEVHLRHLVDAGRLRVHVLDPWPSLSRALRVADNAGDDVVVVPDGDRWLPHLLRVVAGTGPRATYRLLLLRPELADSVATTRSSQLRRALKRVLVRTVLVAGRGRVQVFGLVDAFGRGAASVLDQVVPVSDPVLPRLGTSTPVHDEPTRGLVVGLLGAVDERKSPGLLAAGCREVFQGSLGRLVVVGGVSPGAADLLGAAGLSGEQLSVDDRYVEDDELVRAAASCDVIALLHTNHDSSSGVLALAAQVGRPVLVPRGSRLAATAGDFGLATELTVDGVASALRRAVAEAPTLRTAASDASRLLGTADFVTKLTGPVA
jgi:hypothetical protein